MNILSLVQTALELSLICSLTVLALFLSYSMLNVCDLSTDGCFTLGAAVGAMVAIAGHPYLAIPAAMGAGVLSGFITALLQTKMGIDSLLAGIIVNTGLYSINIAVMGGSSLLNMNKTETVFTKARALLQGTFLAEQYKLLVAAIAVIAVIVFLALFLHTRLGLAIRATGDNPDMVRSSSINPTFTTIVGLCVANAFTGLSGCLLAQSQKSVSIDIGTGMVTIALASLLMGQVLLGKGSILKRAIGMVVGAFAFRLVYTIALRLDMPAFMLKIEKISKTFNPGTIHEKAALQGLSLHLLPGDFVTVIGSNGAGKSTLLNAISGSFFTDSGSIYLDGRNITFLPEYQRSRQIGRLFQDPMRGSAPHMTIEENLSLAAASGGWLSHVTRAEKAAFREKLAQLDMGLENRMKQPVGLLSGGQRQALTLVMATFKPPKLLLLDEHTAALDPATAEKVLEITRQTVSENRITTLMVTHNMHQALELGNRTLMMDRGHIILDVAGAERAGMTVEDLLAKFKSGAGKALDNDRILLSEQTNSNKKGASNATD